MAPGGNYLLSEVLERNMMKLVWEYECYYGMGRIACKPFREIRIETKVADTVRFPLVNIHCTFLIIPVTKTKHLGE